MRNTLLIFFFLMATFSGRSQGVQESRTIDITPISDYLLYLPDGYDESPLREWPLMLFLHGSGERGSDLSKVKVHGPPKLVAQGRDLPFVVVSPQCPQGRWWSVDDLNILLEEVVKNYNIDRDRIYVSGLSMGGFGTWDLALQYPDRFAAIAPICGGSDPDKACVIKDVPAWVFHGAKDNVVPVTYSQQMVDALRACGSSEVKLTIYPEANHDSWTKTYDNPEFFDWMLEHRRTHQWSREFSVFEQQDEQITADSVEVLFTGSSSIRMWESLKEDFPDVKVLNRGFGGSQIEDLLNYPRKLILKYRPKKLVIYSGDNDLHAGKTPDRVARDFINLFKIVERELPETQIIYIAIKPSPSRANLLAQMKAANDKIRSFLEKQENGIFIDVYSAMLDKKGRPKGKLFLEDNLHMNKKGYALWEKMLDDYVEAK